MVFTTCPGRGSRFYQGRYLLLLLILLLVLNRELQISVRSSQEEEVTVSNSDKSRDPHLAGGKKWN
jgi:hypothetical protein